MASFDIVPTTGQIRTISGVSYDHEAKDSYTVTVTATDGTASAVADRHHHHHRRGRAARRAVGDLGHGGDRQLYQPDGLLDRPGQ